MPQEITRTQIEKYTVYTGPTAESFSPIMAGITYPDPAYEILVYRRPLCVFEYVLSGRGHIERNGSILIVNGKARKIKTYRTFCYLLVSYSPILVLFQHFSDQFYTSIPS